jgi:hypothetical protein
MRHAKHPRARLFNLDALSPLQVKAQKDLLRGFLRLSRVQAQSEQVVVHVLPRILENTCDLILDPHSAAAAPLIPAAPAGRISRLRVFDHARHRCC